MLYKDQKTTIGNDVRIWVNVTILSGIKIWDWAIIWAGAVVTKDIEPYAIVWWVPAKMIKKRYDEETVNKLLEIQRRNRPLDKIKENTEVLWSPDILNFLKQFSKD